MGAACIGAGGEAMLVGHEHRVPLCVPLLGRRPSGAAPKLWGSRVHCYRVGSTRDGWHR